MLLFTKMQGTGNDFIIVNCMKQYFKYDCISVWDEDYETRRRYRLPQNFKGEFNYNIISDINQSINYIILAGSIYNDLYGYLSNDFSYPEFDQGTSYQSGTIVNRNGYLRKFTRAYTANSPSTLDWGIPSLSQLIN